MTSPSAHPTANVPSNYKARTILQGVGRPDDLVFDLQGHLLFSDAHNGTISRLNANGTVTVLLQGLGTPEGLVMLSNGTLIIAEQGNNRILALTSGATSPTVLHTLPGTPSSASCKNGVDGIALDPSNNTLIIPDSPTGEVYRMSLDGRSLTLLASGITRPVGAAVDNKGTIYIADECGAALWTISPSGKTARIGGFGMPDDIVLDAYGDVLVTDLAPSVHALLRYNLTTGKRETLASQGYIEPQGLAIDGHGNIYVSDDYANIIVEYTPV
jgi:sugar lactone lactonase YvrE